MTTKARCEETAEYDTVDEFAGVFNVSPSSVRRAISRRQVRALKFGGSVRIPRSERERLRQVALSLRMTNLEPVVD